jgi:two-component system alkaline phosphatase synthesis response regulator PhoP
MSEKSQGPKLKVYCPELMKMIGPGEFSWCPYYQAEKLTIEDEEGILKQVFRCHVKCGCTVHYQYYEGGELKTKTIDVIENEDRLRELIKVGSKETATSKKKVLLVDDDEDFLFIHSSLLNNHGYEVITAESEKECREKLKTITPDLIILDVMMEHLDSGFDLSKEIKGRFPSVPIILLTSIVEETGLPIPSSDDAKKKLLHADAFINKPVNQENLLKTIKELLS